MLDREGEDIAILLNPAYQYLSLYLASLINDNPGAFVSDLTIDNAEEIRDYLDEYQNTIMAEQVITPLWQYRISRIWADMLNTVSGNGIAWISNTLSSYGGYWRQAPPAINNEVELQLAIPNGVYYVNFKYVKYSDAGIVKILMDNTEVGSIDTYNSVLTYDNYYTTNNFNVNTHGAHTIGLRVPSKNASSSGYFNRFLWLDLIRFTDL